MPRDTSIGSFIPAGRDAAIGYDDGCRQNILGAARAASHFGRMDHDLTHLGLLEDEDLSLDFSALALAALDHPDANREHYEAVLEDISHKLNGIGGAASTARSRADALARVMAAEFGFAGDRDDYDNPENADLIRVIDRRRGLPVSLSILYVSAARRQGWDAQVLDVPGHVLVLIGSDASPVVIDPFAEGQRVTPDELATLAQRSSAGTASAVRQIAAMANRAVLVRLLQNQASRAEAAGKAGRALVLYERMTIFAPSYGHAWWERARLELMDGRVDDARASLSAMLEVTRKRELRTRILALLGRLGTR